MRFGNPQNARRRPVKQPSFPFQTPFSAFE